MSEERFAASLDGVEANDRGAAGGDARREQGQSGRHMENARSLARSAVAKRANGSVAVQVTKDNREASLGVDNGGAFWRNEVVSRVESYRARRRRPLRERSLPLDFERAVNREVVQGQLAESGEPEDPPPPPSAEEMLVQAVDYFVTEPAASNNAQETADTKIIEFPRPAIAPPVIPPSFEELAETIIDRPRILDVPEAVETDAPLADINVAPEDTDRLAVDFELPLLVAPMSKRVFAALVDAFLVMAAAGVFVTIALKTGVQMPQAKAGFLLAMTVPCLSWAMYEYLFLVYAGTTPGLRLAGLHLVTFDGRPVRRRARRLRALAKMLSTLSLGLGVLWALLDEDTLCWHDRITRTYVVGNS